LLVATIVLAVVLTPRIIESKREAAREERREAARAAAAERAQLRAEQRPRRGSVSASAPIPGVEGAITTDAVARHGSGELSVRAKTTECRSLRREGRRLLLGCTAVTSDVARTENSRGVLIGYPYRAAVDLETGRYALCKTSGRPGEGALTREKIIPLPAACGGEGASPSEAAAEEVRSSVEGLYAAAARQEGQAMCRLLTPAWRTRLERPPGGCAVDALRVVLGPGPPRGVEVGGLEIDGARAIADAEAERGHGAAESTYRHRIELTAVEGRWLVADAAEKSSD
jgi:hypothetical protein